MSYKFRPKPFIIPIFIPHAGCPHRCVFCDQTRTTRQPEALPTAAQLNETISRYLGYRKDPDRYTEISFYGGNFLGLPSDDIRFLLERATCYVAENQVQGIRFSTRPDTITPQRMNLLESFPITTIELGVQSMNNHVLAASRRGHSAEDILRAVTLLKDAAYRLGLQMMVGLPGDTPETAMATGNQIADFEPDFVRIYPTLVLKGSRLAEWYGQGRYHPMTLDEAVSLVKVLYTLFVRKGIKVVRMGLQTTDGLDSGEDWVAGPFHPAFGELVQSALWLEIIDANLQNNPIVGEPLIIRLNPKLMSQIQGHHNRNIEALSREHALSEIIFSRDNKLPLDMIQLNGRPCRLFN